MDNLGEVGKILNGTFVPVSQRAERVVDTHDVTAEAHMQNTARHLTPEQSSKIESSASGTDLFNERQERIAGDTQLAQNLSNETLRAETAEQELQSRIENEEDRAAAAESTLQSNITAEASARQTADAQLQSNIDAETARAQSAESTIASALTTETSERQAADSAEETARQSADNDLQAQVDSLHGQTRRFFIDFAAEFGTDTPTKAQADAWLAARMPVPVEPNIGVALKNNNTSQTTYNHLFVYYVDPDNANELILSDDGVDTVSTASSSSLGIVRGGGAVSVDLNGDMHLNANAGTDAIIGTRTLSDNAGIATLLPTSAKNLTQWLQGIRDNLKALLSYFTNGVANKAAKLNTSRNISIDGKVTGTATGFDGTKDITINVTALSQTATDYPTLNQNTTGNATTATRLAASVNLNVGGDVTGTAKSFNGSAAITIPVTLNANTGTDNVIGKRALTDASASDTLVPTSAKNLTEWLQGIRNNIKDYFDHKASTSNPHSVTAEQISAAELSGAAFIGQVTAGGAQTLDTAQIRNVYAGTASMAANAPLETGTIYLIYSD